MAWTAQAQRFAHVGLHDPSQPFTEQQSRLALANVPAASDLVVFSGLQIDYDESLSFQRIPHPGGWDVTTRYALAGVPTIGLSDSINRDGTLGPTLGSFTVDFDGTRTLPVFDGGLVPTLGSFSVSLLGDVVFRHYLDISYSITPTWVVTEHPARFGDLVTTLDSFTASVTGFSLPPDSTQGLVDTSLGAFSTDFDGTYTSPPTFSGSIGLDIEAFNASLAGSFVASGGVIGSISPTIGSFSPLIQGSFTPFTTDGDLNLTLGEFSISIQGQFIDASTISGSLDTTIGSFITSILGTSDLSDIFDKAQARMTDKSDVRSMTDTPDTRNMR